MRVLLVHRLIARFGGAHKYALELVELFRKLDWTVSVALNPNESLRDFREQLTARGASLFDVDFDADTGAAARALDRAIDEIAPDLVDLQSAARSVRTTLLEPSLYQPPPRP